MPIARTQEKEAKGTTIPEPLRPFAFHGVVLSWEGKRQAEAEQCPFCSKEGGRFRVAVDSGLWDCKACGASGNPLDFLRQLWAAGEEATTESHWDDLATNRGLLDGATAKAWGAIRSPITDEWLLPGKATDGRLVQLYRYVRYPRGTSHAGGRMRLLATPGFDHGLFLPGTSSPVRPGTRTVYVAEGPWDGMVLWEALRGTKRSSDGRFVPTAAEPISLLAGAAVIAVPGCQSFAEKWGALFEGRKAVLCYDSDHPGKNGRTGAYIAPAGAEGAKRAANVLARYAPPPEEVHWLRWGEEGYDPSLPSGHDVRDALSGPDSGGGDPRGRAAALGLLLDRIAPIPAEWLGGRTLAAVRAGGTTLELLPCESWSELVNDWRKAMKWPASGLSLDHGLACCLASALSTETIGDQVWIKLMAPPSTGKTTIAEALAASARYVKPLSVLTSLHSGYKSEKEGTTDHSLIPKLRGKTLIVKDGDTLLQSPQLGKILGELRDLYDGASRNHYGHGVARDYENVRMSFVLCGTAALRQLDASELGARCLDVIMLDRIDAEEEDDIAWRQINRIRNNAGKMSNGSAESFESPEMTRCRARTGGYVEFLRGRAGELLSAVSFGDEAARQVTWFGAFVAHLRGRPSLKQEEVVERELSARLVGQFGKLAQCLAAVLNKRDVDDEVMARVRQVALDTARGWSLDAVRLLHRAGPIQGASLASLAHWTNQTDEKMKKRIHYLRDIHVAESFQPETRKGLAARPRWRLTERMQDLFRKVDADAIA